MWFHFHQEGFTTYVCEMKGRENGHDSVVPPGGAAIVGRYLDFGHFFKQQTDPANEVSSSFKVWKL